MKRADEIMMFVTGNIQPQPVIGWDEASKIIEELLEYHITLLSFIEVYKRSCEIALDTEGTLYKAASQILEHLNDYDKDK